MSEKFSIEFMPSGRGKAQCPSDPKFPQGKIFDLRLIENVASCDVDLEWPSPECGAWVIRCQECKSSALVTCAGRKDDPIKIKINCKN